MICKSRTVRLKDRLLESYTSMAMEGKSRLTVETKERGCRI